MANHRCPVKIRGVTYPSQTEAARVLGVRVQSLHKALANGTIDNVGLGPGQNRKGVKVDGVEYPSHRAASLAFGRREDYLTSARVRARKRGATYSDLEIGRVEWDFE